MQSAWNGSVLCAAAMLFAQLVAAEPARNPFVPVATVAARTEAKPVAADPVRRLPDVNPGPYRPPQLVLPPPLPGLPPLAVQRPDNSLPPAPRQDTPLAIEKKSDAFLSREALQAQRAKCSVALKSSSELRFAAEGGQQVVRLELVGGRQCVKGVAVSQAWLDASAVSDRGELVITVGEHEGVGLREAEVMIANTGQSFSVRILQDPSPNEFRELKL